MCIEYQEGLKQKPCKSICEYCKGTFNKNSLLREILEKFNNTIDDDDFILFIKNKIKE